VTGRAGSSVRGPLTRRPATSCTPSTPTPHADTDSSLDSGISTTRRFKVNFGIYVASTRPFQAALGAESRVCNAGNTADSQPQWALTYRYISQSTANQNEKLIHRHRWGLNPRPSARKCSALSPNPFFCFFCLSQLHEGLDLACGGQCGALACQRSQDGYQQWQWVDFSSWLAADRVFHC
jgi:hypothetical protein